MHILHEPQLHYHLALVLAMMTQKREQHAATSTHTHSPTGLEHKYRVPSVPCFQSRTATKMIKLVSHKVTELTYGCASRCRYLMTHHITPKMVIQAIY
jgi:D-alanyl-D-alanine carboxypeptidase